MMISGGSGDGQFESSHNNLEHREIDEAHPQYILKAGGIFTGDVELEDALIDGVHPSTHAHSGLDGTQPILGSDILGGTLSSGAIDRSDTPPKPLYFRVVEETAHGTTGLTDVTLAWEGSAEYTYEVQYTPFSALGE